MTTAEKACLGCTLPICDDRSKECKFVVITRGKRPRDVSGRFVPNAAVDRRSLPVTGNKIKAAKERNKRQRMRAALAARRQKRSGI